MTRTTMLQISTVYVLGATMLGACSPVNIQKFSAATSASGNPAYSVDGYTKLNETSPGDARRYAQEFGNSVCSEGAVVMRVDTLPTHNGFGDFLYWQAIVECQQEASPTNTNAVVAQTNSDVPTPAPAPNLNSKPADINRIDNVTIKAKCMDWLKAHYKSNHKITDIDEYEINGKYTYKGNFEITPFYGNTTVIGYECIYIKSQKRLIGLTDLSPHAMPVKPNTAVAKLKAQRVRFGYSACPSLKSWKRLVDELARKNYKAELPSSCIFLREGNTIYMPPSDTAKHKEAAFVKIKIASGQSMWIEAYNVE